MRTLKFNNPDMRLYVASMGKIFQVTAVCRNDEEANAIMAKHPEQAVMACDCNGLVYLANQYCYVCRTSQLTAARLIPLAPK